MVALIFLFFIPFISAILVFLLPLGKIIKPFAFSLSLIPIFILLFYKTNLVGAYVQYSWLTSLSIQFYLSVDSLSLVFLYITAIIIPISILSERSFNIPHQNIFYGMILLLQGLLIGFFTARDLVLFTILWEGMLLPLYFIMTIWGGPRRQFAAIKFLIYMLAGSALMVVAVLSLYFASTGNETFNLDQLAAVSGIPNAKIVCAIFLLAFAVKTPLFPFHAWLPDAYYQSSTTGTILLSAVLSKAGIYGILRITLDIFPTILKEWSPLLITLAIIGVIYGGLAAWMQNDYKRLIAYSSFSHVNFILAGLFVINQTAEVGAILQSFNHAITIAALFLVAGWLKENIGTTLIGPTRGLAHFFPYLCWLTMFFVLSSVALPGLNNFIGEILILFGIFKYSPWFAAALGVTVILSVIYMLRWMQNVYFEDPKPAKEAGNDIQTREFFIAAPLIALILWMGIYPQPFLNQIESYTIKSITVAQLEKQL